MGIAGVNSLSKLALICILFIAQWHLQTVRIAGDNWKTVIVNDGAGYYAYLPATFIYRNFDYNQEQTPDNIPPVKKAQPTGAIKYYYGEAVLLLPFFTIADLITQALNWNERTGYTFYYQLLAALAGVFYLLVGLVMSRAMLLRMRYSDGVVAFVLLLIFLSTQVYHYALNEPLMSHVYSFAMVSALLNLYHLQLTNYKAGRWVLIAFVASLIVFIRPVNFVFLAAFIPLSASWPQSKYFIKSFFRSPKVVFFSSFLIPALLFFGQSYLYFQQTSHWWVNSYGEEGFNWLDPHFLDVLFSYRKGLFVYAPILLLSLPGIWILGKRESWFWTSSWLILMFVFLYVTSSWWYWAYGGSLGMRPFVDAYPLFIIPLAAFVEFTFKYLSTKVLLFVVCSCLAFLQLFQTYQYKIGVLPYEYMSKEKYWHLFLKNSHQFKYVYPPENELKQSKQAENIFYDRFVLKQDSIIELYKNNELEPQRFELIADSWSKVIPNDNIQDTLYIDISGEVIMEDASTNASLIIAFQENWKAFFWEQKYLVHQITKDNLWTPIKFILPLPKYRPSVSHFTVSINNENDSKIQARKLRIRFFSK